MSETDFIKRFEAFARSKPADERYKQCDADKCALAQFGYPGIHSNDVIAGKVPQVVYQAIFGDNTFGALADRLHHIAKQRL